MKRTKKAEAVRPGDLICIYGDDHQRVTKVRIIRTFVHGLVEPRVSVRLHWGYGASWSEYGPDDLVPVGN